MTQACLNHNLLLYMSLPTRRNIYKKNPDTNYKLLKMNFIMVTILFSLMRQPIRVTIIFHTFMDIYNSMSLLFLSMTCLRMVTSISCDLLYTKVAPPTIPHSHRDFIKWWSWLLVSALNIVYNVIWQRS